MLSVGLRNFVSFYKQDYNLFVLMNLDTSKRTWSLLFDRRCYIVSWQTHSKANSEEYFYLPTEFCLQRGVLVSKSGFVCAVKWPVTAPKWSHPTGKLCIVLMAWLWLWTVGSMYSTGLCCCCPILWSKNPSDLINFLLSAGSNCPSACGWVGWQGRGIKMERNMSFWH